MIDKRKLKIYINKLLYVYNFIVIKLIQMEDIQRRRVQYKKEYAELSGFAKTMGVWNSKINYWISPKKFSIKEQLEILEALKMAVKFSNPITQPFEFMSKRKDLRLFVRLRCWQVFKELDYQQLYTCLEGKGILDDEYIYQIEVAYRTNNFIPTYDSIIESLKDKRKRRTTLIIVAIQPVFTFVVAIGTEVFVSLSVVPDLILNIPADQYPPTVESYVILRDILLEQKLEYTLKISMVLSILFIFFKLDATKLLLHLTVLQVPIINNYIAKWEISKFFDSLNAMILSGSSLQEALEVSNKLVSNIVIRRSLMKDISVAGNKTNDLSVIFKDSVYIESRVRNQLKLASESGSDSESILQGVVDEYKDYMRVLLETPATLIIPIMLACGGLYLFARLVPLFTEIQDFTVNLV